MNERSLHVLEYGKIRQQMADYCKTERGRVLAESLTPSSELPVVLQRQRETEEARSLLGEIGGNPIIAFADVRSALHLARIGGTLTSRALLDVAGCLRSAGSARRALVTDRENTPILRGLASALVEYARLERQISDIVLSEEEIADSATPELHSIRRKMRACNDRVRERLNGMIRNPNFQKYLQDAIVTVRSDRYVLPVRQEYRAMVPGIVHDQSGSGATLFIEPMSVVEIGNELKGLIAAEKEEVARILQMLSAEIAPFAEQIEGNMDLMAQIDFIFARAALGEAMNAVMPKINDEKKLCVIRGRHPLIDPAKVVPLDIRLGDAFDILMITGPNTGGKTVTLKTIGLFAAMAQSGMQIPAEYGSQMPVYADIFADIGDEQSIEQSLSTFSGHMKNIVGILCEVTPEVLVLFDELGAGTDPTEGAALAQAILSRLRHLGTSTVATTHYSELKEFAMTTERVENASVEFDVATLRPTYRLLIGIPGKSNAFEISRKLGLEDALIEAARELLSKEQVRFEDVLASAEYHRQVAQREAKLAEEAREEMTAIRRQAELEKKKLEEQRDRLLQKAKDEAKRLTANARREQEELIAELRAMRKEGGAQEHEIQQIRKRAEESAAKLQTQEEQSGGEALKSVQIGQLVHVASMDLDANVVALPDAKGNVQLKAGMIKLRAPLSDLREPTADQRKAKKAKEKQIRRQQSGSARVDITTREIRRELDIRGMAVNEAMPEVEKFLDDATLSSLGEVSIIHGVGTGVLRQAITDGLRRHPAVRAFRLGRYGEGEAGVTIVSLR